MLTISRPVKVPEHLILPVTVLAAAGIFDNLSKSLTGTFSQLTFLQVICN